MKSKRDFIEKVYGDNWNMAKKYVDENGWIGYGHLSDADDLEDGITFETDADRLYEIYSTKAHQSSVRGFRPQELSAIEDNNGWNLISEGLPEKTMYCELCIHGNPTPQIFKFSKKNGHFYSYHQVFTSKRITHWKEIKLSEKPIY